MSYVIKASLSTILGSIIYQLLFCDGELDLVRALFVGLFSGVVIKAYAEFRC